MTKLNLKYVTDIVASDINKWRKGDTVLINCQTGTGKTYLVTETVCNKLESYEKLIYICNRVELKRQIKLDLLKNNKMEIQYIGDMVDIDWLDNQRNINNVTIASYHELAESKLDNIYHNQQNRLHDYDYIICDECHFFLTDASYNHKTYLSFIDLVMGQYYNSIKIFMSATIEEVENAINVNFNKNEWTSIANNIFKYSTGIDYSYLNVKYFNDIEDIANLISNDKTDNKWMIFVTSKTKGDKLNLKLKEYAVSSEFIHVESDNNEIKQSITDKCQFDNKVLITTKMLDNGVNIKDNKVVNLVVMSYDKVTFIQEIGRKRININNAQSVNLYIPTLKMGTFTGILNTTLNPKLNKVDLFIDDKIKFKRQFNNNLKSVPSDLFYLNKDNEWDINRLGYQRLLNDISFSKQIIEVFKKDQFAYVKQQLEWLGLSHKFSESNLIENVVNDDDTLKVELKLDTLYGKEFLTKQDRQPLIEAIGIIDGNHSSFKDDKIVYFSRIEALNSYLEETNSKYRIKQYSGRRDILGNKKIYKQIWTLIK